MKLFLLSFSKLQMSDETFVIIQNYRSMCILKHKKAMKLFLLSYSK